MSSLSSLLVVSALVATGGQATSGPTQPPTDTATVSFVSEDQMLAGTLYGIDGIDAVPRAFDQRLTADITAGNRSVWYSCPNAPQMKDGSRITYNFVAGQRYELVCRPGKDAEIRPSGEC